MFFIKFTCYCITCKQHKNRTFNRMAKVKYYYDEDTLSYRKIEKKKSDYYKNSVIYTIAILLVAFLGFVVFSQFIVSPTERVQKRELENLKLNYELLSKRMEEGNEILNELQKRDDYVYRTYFEANPIPEEQRKSGFGGANRYKYLEGYDNSNLIKKITKDMDVLSKQLVVQSKSLDEIIELAKEKETMLASIPAIMPLKKEDCYISSGFKWRMHPILKIRKFHKGMDFTAKRGTPIYATGDGVVAQAKRSATFGKVVYINHGFGYETIYAHMSKIATSKGKKVKRGDLIGYVGNTGRSVAPHLHYEVHKNGKAVNPVNFYYGNLTPEEFEAIQNLAQQEGQSYD